MYPRAILAETWVKNSNDTSIRFCKEQLKRVVRGTAATDQASYDAIANAKEIYSKDQVEGLSASLGLSHDSPIVDDRGEKIVRCYFKGVRNDRDPKGFDLMIDSRGNFGVYRSGDDSPELLLTSNFKPKDVELTQSLLGLRDSCFEHLDQLKRDSSARFGTVKVTDQWTCQVSAEIPGGFKATLELDRSTGEIKKCLINGGADRCSAQVLSHFGDLSRDEYFAAMPCAGSVHPQICQLLEKGRSDRGQQDNCGDFVCRRKGYLCGAMSEKQTVSGDYCRDNDAHIMTRCLARPVTVDLQTLLGNGCASPSKAQVSSRRGAVDRSHGASSNRSEASSNRSEASAAK